jgi:hypothetical protein
VFFEHIIPDFEVVEGVLFGDVVDHNCAVGIFHVVGDQAAEALLSGGVPELYSELMTVAGHIFDVEVDADGGLNGCLLTLSPSSNLSLMYF